MSSINPTPLRIPLGAEREVGGLLMIPKAPKACFVFAHGAGAGMAHAFMTAFAEGLAVRQIATLRYQFPLMEQGSKRPDAPALAHIAVRAAVAAAVESCPGLPLIAGGKSFGARMTSQAQALGALPRVRGLAFAGFPLHPADKPGTDRADHLSKVKVPMLFLQGTRDKLARLDLLREVVDQLGAKASLSVQEDADHSFHVRVRSGRNDAQVLSEVLDRVADWAKSVCGA